MAMVGRNGVTNGMKTLIPMVMVSSRERLGGKVSTEKGGIEHGVRATMALDGFTNMGRAAVEPQETWYERYPHYGFYHCFANSVQLREVQKPSED